MNRSVFRTLGLAVVLILLTLQANAQDLRVTGMASTYAQSEVGQPTASGAVYDGNAYTACHASLPFGTVVKVTNLRTNKTVLVTINDRFDYKTNRVIDVSHAAAKELGLFENIAPMVRIEVISWPTEETKTEETGNEG
ncbi:MAG: septal ring lytic transglycosylase RlpA family protein [Bacteroidota bacterium]|nr:septal ring lytic transglycosylase RlpA family protein [Bacteroidota bacterium]MDX5431262.1 septal ring lytic transglycosylase RlpA family protein [Bacteroidota bacterium]MDX5470001.1 septal ring lytic transglycosylase RlpA family protein [Bacteroidota bacterium]